MALPQFTEQERRRAARHEAGHWLCYHKYSFEADGIQIDQTNSGRFGAEVQFLAHDPTAPGYADHLKNRMRTVIAGFVAEAIPDATGKAQDYPIATDWKPYFNYKGDYKRFDDLLAELIKLEPPPEGEDARQYYAKIMRSEVQTFLFSVPAALDAIQAARLETTADRLDAATLKSLPAVRSVIEALEKERTGTASGTATTP